MEEAPSDHPGDRLSSPASSLECPVSEIAVGTAYMSTSSPSSSHCSPLLRPARHVRSNSFQRWRRQMQRAWRWGPAVGSNSSREHGFKAIANVEIMANQKREWYQIKSKARDQRQLMEPTSTFEHFFIIGLHSYANVEVIEDAFAKRKSWESEVASSEILNRVSTLEPQILFKYPPGKRVAMRESELLSFCFPEGVKARLIERTPSMSDLNEVVFGQHELKLHNQQVRSYYQLTDLLGFLARHSFPSFIGPEHLAQDDSSFIFCLKVSDNATLYGVCLHVQEIVQRAPSILGAVSPLINSSCMSSRFLVSAPRCYCILTRVPFFELHYEMLNSIIAQERLDRITHFVSEITLSESVQGTKEHDQLEENFESPDWQSCNNWMGFAIPVDSVSGLISSSESLVPDRDAPSCTVRGLEPQSPESVSASEASDVSHVRELDKENRKASQESQHCDDYASETSGSRSDSFERVNENFDNGHTSPEVGTMYCSSGRRLERVESMESVYSSARGAVSDDEDDEVISRHETVAGDGKVMEWARANNNEALQIVCGYHALPLPPRGSEVVFHPLEHLQPIKYSRPGLSSLGFNMVYGTYSFCPSDANEIIFSEKVNAQLTAAEEALALSIWSVATVCRALSLESVLALITGALLEKQVVVLCPNLGVLSAIVLSIIPTIRPFEWQSLLLPILPRKMVEFLDAPVPYIVGIQHKPAGMNMKAANRVRINVNKDQVKTCSLPQLPRYRELFSDLSPIHARLSCEKSIAQRHPVYRCSEIQAESSNKFLGAIRCYLESFCANLRSHTITNVQSNNDKVSLLLKDSFIDSFPTQDRPFMKDCHNAMNEEMQALKFNGIWTLVALLSGYKKLFVDTQLFSVLSDSRLSSYENE